MCFRRKQIENEGEHARKSFAISPISRRSPQYINLAASDMTFHGGKELDQHSNKHGVTIVSFIDIATITEEALSWWVYLG